MRTLFNCAIGIAALSTLALAQGKYETLGSGCGAVGSAGIQVNNKNATAANAAAALYPNEYSYPVNVSATTVTVVTGVRFFTKSSGGFKSVDVRIYMPSAASATTPNSKPLDTTRMTVGPNSNYWVANFNKPHIVKGTFWVSFDCYETGMTYPQGPSVVNASNLTTGTNITPVFWRRPASAGPGTWSQTGLVKIPAYDILKGGTPPPVLSAASAPVVGKAFQLDVKQAPNGAAVAAFGASSAAWGPIKLPLDLSAVAPGCFVFQGLDLLLTAGVANGTGKVVIPIPNNKALVGSKFLNQWIVLSKSANALGLLFSNGGAGTIG
jgi:hypothetical protein